MSDLEGGVSWLILIFWVMACARSCWRASEPLGKALNTELKRKVSETVDDAKKAAAEAGDKAAAAADTSAADKPADEGKAE